MRYMRHKEHIAVHMHTLSFYAVLPLAARCCCALLFILMRYDFYFIIRARCFFMPLLVMIFFAAAATMPLRVFLSRLCLRASFLCAAKKRHYMICAAAFLRDIIFFSHDIFIFFSLWGASAICSFYDMLARCWYFFLWGERAPRRFSPFRCRHVPPLFFSLLLLCAALWYFRRFSFWYYWWRYYFRRRLPAQRIIIIIITIREHALWYFYAYWYFPFFLLIYARRYFSFSPSFLRYACIVMKMSLRYIFLLMRASFSFFLDRYCYFPLLFPRRHAAITMRWGRYDITFLLFDIDDIIIADMIYIYYFCFLCRLKSIYIFRRRRCHDIIYFHFYL